MPTPNAVNAQLLISGVFTDKTVFSSEGIEVQVGPDVETGIRQNKITHTWDNSDLSMDPSNVLSPLYGLIGLNTQCKLKVGGTTLCVAEAVKWAPDRTQGHTVTPPRGRSSTDFSAEGVLRRLGKWADTIRSPIFRQISSYDPTKLLGYWSAEGPGTNLPNAISGGFTGKVTGTATWAGNAGPGGSDKTIQLGADGAMSASFIRGSGTGWQIAFMAQLGSLPPSASLVTFFNWRTSTGVTYQFQSSNGGFQVLATRDDDTVLATVLVGWGAGVSPDKWTRYRVKATVSGSTVTLDLSWYPQDGTVLYGTTGTFSATSTGFLSNWFVTPTTATANTSYGHILGTSDTTLDLTTTYAAVASMNGYIGELAGNRYNRLCDEEGITHYMLGSASTTVAMGRQKPGLFLDLLQECSTTDRAILYDEPTDVALMFRTRTNRYSQTSKLDLTYGNGTHVQAMQKIIDDVGVVNHVTVTNTTGASVTRILASGAYSVQAPPNGVGRVKGEVNVNQADDGTIDDRASFELNLLSQGRPRYQQITVDLLANPSLVAACNTIRPGDLITLAGVEPDPVPLHVITYTHRIGHVDRQFVMTCVPGELWKTGAYDTTAAGNVYGLANSTTAGASTTTANQMVVNVPDPLESWSTSSAPYTWTLLGERITVTGMSTVGSIANTDGTFETGTLIGWGTPSSATFVSSTAQAQNGTRSGLLTVTGTPVQAYVRNSPNVAVVAGQSYRLIGWIRATSALANVSMSIDWATAGAVYLSTSAQTATLVANTWTLFDQTFVAPATAALAGYGPTLGGSPATGAFIWVDGIDFVSPGLLTQTATVTRSVNGVVRSHAAGEKVLVYDQVRYAY